MDLPFNFKTDQASTLFKQLSGVIIEKFAETNPTFAQLLSTTAVMQTLSTVPLPPYEQMKQNLFGKDYKFKTIEDLSVPENFNLQDLTNSLHKISKSFQQKTLSAADLFSAKLQTPTFEETNMFGESFYHVTENDIIDPDLTRKNIEFSEIVRSLNLEQLKEEPVETAKKLITCFVKIYQ